MKQTSTAPQGKSSGTIERGKKYRFVVSSAEEAISVLRDRLGPEAKVLTVKQAGGEGLGRFLSAPKLEIVATIPEKPDEEAASATAKPERQKTPARPGAEENEAGSKEQDPHRDELEAELASEEPAPRSRKSPYSEISGKSGKRERNDVWAILRGAGFDENLLGSLRYVSGADEVNIDRLPLPRALAEVNRRLRLEYQAIDEIPVSGRIAFFGTPGVGKTTALCKRLSSDVFLKRKSVEVLKLDSDTPNPDDALCLFCDVLGVPLNRDAALEELKSEADVLYVDLPGMPIGESEQWDRLRRRLDSLDIGTRVLVINGMYEASLVGAAFDLGEKMGATHLVVTHMDEMLGAAKLWPFVLRGKLCPLFASHGQNVTSDYSEDVLRIMLEKTFPASIIN